MIGIALANGLLFFTGIQMSKSAQGGVLQNENKVRDYIHGESFKRLLSQPKQWIYFGMCFTPPPMPAFSDYSVMMNDHAAHPWIGTHAACAHPPIRGPDA